MSGVEILDAAVRSGDQAVVDAGKPVRAKFVNRRDQPRLSPQEASRQGRAVTFALRAFPSSTAAMAFLNSPQPELGRPLDLAIASEAGLAAVEAALAALTPMPS